MTPDEFARIVRAAAQEGDKEFIAYLHALYELGARADSILTLKWLDLSPQFANQSSKRFLISTDFRSQIAKELLEGICFMMFDQVIEQFQGRDGTGKMIVEISMEVPRGFGMGHNALSKFPPERVAFRTMFAAVQSVSTMLERA